MTLGADHTCFVKAGAAGPIKSEWCTRNFASTLAALPADLAEADVLRDDLRLCTEGALELFFVPFDQVRPQAKVVLVGLTPGRQQMAKAINAARSALCAGESVDAAILKAKDTAGFAGSMRTNLCTMLDGIGLAETLGIRTTSQFFADRSDLLSATSAICHAVFVHGRNYSGTPRIDQSALLSAFARQVLATELSLVPEALVVPLGKEASNAVAMTGIDKDRVLRGFPHPSGANGHRHRQFEANRANMTAQIAKRF